MANSAKALPLATGSAFDFDPGSPARIEVTNSPPARDRQARLLQRRFRLSGSLASVIASHAYQEASR